MASARQRLTSATDGNPFVLDGHSSTLSAPDYRGSTVARTDIDKLP